MLSACQSGLGEGRRGEGVLGLRRGFALAGVENLVFSLWSVGDEPTSELMSRFYSELFEHGDIERAFTSAQRSELKRWRERSSLHNAVLSAGGFVLAR